MCVYIWSFIFISIYVLTDIYLPDINWHIYDEVGIHFINKVSNMSLTTALRFDGFDKLQKDNTVKLAQFVNPLFNVTNNDFSSVFPLTWINNTSNYLSCTKGVSKLDKEIMMNTDDLWQISTTAKFGNNSLTIENILVIFEN